MIEPKTKDHLPVSENEEELEWDMGVYDEVFGCSMNEEWGRVMARGSEKW